MKKKFSKYNFHITTLINKQATCEAIDDYFTDFFKRAVREQKKKSPDAKIVLVCFYSGHGNWIENSTTIFLADE